MITNGKERSKQEAELMAQCVQDKASEEANKKVQMSVFKNKIDKLQGEINLHASNINHGFTYVDKATTMYRDFDKQRRVYFDKQTGDYLKDEQFHPSDFQKKIDFDEEETARQQQIEENNTTGEFAEGNLDALDNVIIDKKVAKVKKLKPTPKETLHPAYGKDFEQEDEDPFAPLND